MTGEHHDRVGQRDGNKWHLKDGNVTGVSQWRQTRIGKLRAQTEKPIDCTAISSEKPTKQIMQDNYCK